MKLLILLLLLTQSVFAQDQSELAGKFVDAIIQVASDEIDKGIRKNRYGKREFNDIKAQHWVAVTFGVDGVTFTGLQKTTLPSLNMGVELFLGKGFYFYSKIGTYSTLPDHRLYNRIDYGSGMNIVIGFGGYVYNDRSWITGQGWSIMLNGGVAYRLAMGSPLEEVRQTIPIFHNIGFELNMKFNYNFLQFLGVSFGPYFAYYAYEQQAISYGITLGLIF